MYFNFFQVTDVKNRPSVENVCNVMTLQRNKTIQSYWYLTLGE